MNTLREHAGQVLGIGFETDEWNGQLEDLLRAVQPGGVIFFQRNIRTAGQFWNLVERIGRFMLECSALPPFLAVDLEGGLVDRFRDLLAPLPSVREAARAGMARELGRMAGREVASFSLNVNFAPVLDVGSRESEAVLGTRTAGETPEEVTRFGEEFLSGLADAGILGCGKHFPGLGSGRLDSHLAMPRIKKDAGQLWEHDVFPFRALAARLPMVMVAHAAYPGLEAEDLPKVNPAQSLPASLSRQIVSALLKGKIGYEGLVLSDDLEMGGVLEGRTVGEAAVAAIEAGCDMLLVCRRAEYVHAAFEAIVCKAETEVPFRDAVDKAAQRVMRTRRQLREPLANRPPDGDALRAEIQTLTAEIQRRLLTDARKGTNV
jgi:beta-N-acetylhexosaminidase